MEIRTPVLALKGLRPSPLDDGGIELKFYHDFLFCKRVMGIHFKNYPVMRDCLYLK